MSCGDPHEIDCAAVIEQMYAYLDQEDTALELTQIRAHLEECAPCLHQFNVEEMLKKLVRRSCACEAAPDHLRVRIITQITSLRIRFEG